MKPLPLLGCLLLALAAAPRVQAQRSPPGTEAGARGSAAAPEAAAPPNYLLTPNDLVRVSVFQEDDMDWTVRVTRDGTVVLPLVGTVSVARKTPDELGGIVKERLHDGYLVHPQVTVTVQEFSKRRFTILGQVQKPGTIDFPDNTALSVIQAIGMAGGFTRGANPSHVFVKRQAGGKDTVLRLDARRMARDPKAAPFEILPGDTITVAESMF